MATDLVVIGAGPKALAIGAKNQVLRELGFEVPEVHIVERNVVAANWTGKNGYTNGRLTLGTSPEKDVGFPYHSEVWSPEENRAVNERMTRFSWQRFLVAVDEFSDWIDRGRPYPEHQKWAQYLQWVAAQLDGHTHFHQGSVTGVSIEGERWKVIYRSGVEKEINLMADGLVLTGPGKVPVPPSFIARPPLFTVETFWQLFGDNFSFAGKKVAIVGAGETAASVALTLASPGGGARKVDVICPGGMIFTRGEGFRENRVYSNPVNGKWSLLTEQDRRNFISRTDRGVFSVRANEILSQAEHIEILPGRVIEVTNGEQAELRIEYNGAVNVKSYDLVVFATGGDQLCFLREIMHPAAQKFVMAQCGFAQLDEALVELQIDRNLGLSGLKPNLHLPMLSGLVQGPGFANLSSLGSLADRVLEPYVKSGAARHHVGLAARVKTG